MDALRLRFDESLAPLHAAGASNRLRCVMQIPATWVGRTEPDG